MKLWSELLGLKATIQKDGLSKDFEFDSGITLKKKSKLSHFFIEDGQLQRGSMDLDADTEKFLSLYLPFCLAKSDVENRKYPWSIAHFAQTLDGKIATHVGHSQWIGNKENQVHAHRMRALCDAVLIGAGTLDRDKPQLTVRHVTGDSPIRVVVGSGEYDYSCLLNDPVPIYVVGDQLVNDPRIEQILIPTGEYEDTDCKLILKSLFKLGIKSVYIEGGSYTASKFLEENVLDEVQLHIAPLIVGSGINNFSLPLKDHLHQSIQFINYQYFHMGKELMFQGEIKH